VVPAAGEFEMELKMIRKVRKVILEKGSQHFFPSHALNIHEEI